MRIFVSSAPSGAFRLTPSALHPRRHARACAFGSALRATPSAARLRVCHSVTCFFYGLAAVCVSSMHAQLLRSSTAACIIYIRAARLRACARSRYLYFFIIKSCINTAEGSVNSRRAKRAATYIIRNRLTLRSSVNHF